MAVPPMRMDDDDPTGAPTGAPTGGAPAWLVAWWVDVTTALTFLTRLPLPLPEPDRPPDLARATRAMPLAGAAIGLGGAAVYGLSAALGLTPAIAGLLAVAATILLTGALHEDGLADSADGLFANAEPARRLEIMRDSRTGAYGVLALILSVGLRATALAAIAAPGPAAAALIAAHALARALPPAVMAWAPLARDDGLAAAAGPAETEHAWTALGLGAAIALLLLGFGAGLAAWIAAGLAGFAMIRLARARIGGYTGDVLGAIEQLGEIAVLLAAAALL
jgi:adenosylcobinamide-GDP ribazoletransferase